MGQDAEVLWVARYEYKKGWVLGQHFHDYFQMIYIVSGNGIFYLDEKEYAIKPGILFMMKPGQTHGLVTDKDDVIKTLDIKYLVHEKGLVSMMGAARNIYSFTDAAMMNLFEKIRLEGMQRRDFFKDFGCVYLLQMLYSLLRYEKEENLSLKQKDDLITEESAEAADRVAEYIRKHYMQDISLKVISESIGYNKSYICQIFCRKYGRPLMKYLYSYRVGKARELMLYSDYSLKQISEMTGFSSIHHFSRMFHKLEGITAGQWRKKERDGIRKDVYISDDFTNTVNTFERLT